MSDRRLSFSVQPWPVSLMIGLFVLILTTLYQSFSWSQPVWMVALVIAGIGFLSAWVAQVAYAKFFDRSR
ncbi:hypothetical protein GGR04_004773 [Aureimonas pseudogalii]|uniref:Uncharacterized protein n=1 Tax=Aureimonas pseudogalii TaxID=1744844 RepID=A0A7W6H9C5_9HYPH|nr:hypothetical protein [Aureimonas pseudogalii]